MKFVGIYTVVFLQASANLNAHPSVSNHCLHLLTKLNFDLTYTFISADCVSAIHSGVCYTFEPISYCEISVDRVLLHVCSV